MAKKIAPLEAAKHLAESARQVADARAGEFEAAVRSGRVWVTEQQEGATPEALTRLSELYDSLGDNVGFWFSDDSRKGFTTGERVFFLLVPEKFGDRMASRFFWEFKTTSASATVWEIEGFVKGALAARQELATSSQPVAGSTSGMATSLSNEVVERMKQEREAAEQEDRQTGREDGRKWAAGERSDYRTLDRMSRAFKEWDESVFADDEPGDAAERVYALMCPGERRGGVEFFEQFRDEVTGDFVAGFVEGALEVVDALHKRM